MKQCVLNGDHRRNHLAGSNPTSNHEFPWKDFDDFPSHVDRRKKPRENARYTLGKATHFF